MVRRLGAVVALLAFLCGFSAAPYTHAHHEIDSATDEHHPHGGTLVHTHASPHSHGDAKHPEPHPASQEDHDDQIRSVKTFVSQQPSSPDAPPVVLVVLGELHVQPAGVWLGADWRQPKAHGPPRGGPYGLRAPPAFPA